MSQQTNLKNITEQQYLEQERLCAVKHEYINGGPQAMAGASENHNRITGNIFGAFHTQLKGSACEPLVADMKVKAGRHYFYPDVMVNCEPDDNDPYFKTSPRIIVEVLSKTTNRMDKTTKRIAYQAIASLQAYVLVEQNRVEVQVLTRESGWQAAYYYLDDEIVLASVGIVVAVKDIYDRVNIEALEAHT